MRVTQKGPDAFQGFLRALRMSQQKSLLDHILAELEEQVPNRLTFEPQIEETDTSFLIPSPQLSEKRFLN